MNIFGRLGTFAAAAIAIVIMDSIPAFAVQAQSKTAALANPIARYIPEVGAAAADRCGRCGFGTSIFRNVS